MTRTDLIERVCVAEGPDRELDMDIARTVEVRNFKDDRVECIDEIVATKADVHIECMSDDTYWMSIGERVFWMRGVSTKKRPARIDLKEE